jgi:hypothetical protein
MRAEKFAKAHSGGELPFVFKGDNCQMVKSKKTNLLRKYRKLQSLISGNIKTGLIAFILKSYE